MIILEQNQIEIYTQGYEDGHRAKRAACHIFNPYMPCTAAHEHYQDGYDLGVLAAKIDMMAEEKVLSISNYRVDTH